MWPPPSSRGAPHPSGLLVLDLRGHKVLCLCSSWDLPQPWPPSGFIPELSLTMTHSVSLLATNPALMPHGDRDPGLPPGVRPFSAPRPVTSNTLTADTPVLSPSCASPHPPRKSLQPSSPVHGATFPEESRIAEHPGVSPDKLWFTRHLGLSGHLPVPSPPQPAASHTPKAGFLPSQTHSLKRFFHSQPLLRALRRAPFPLTPQGKARPPDWKGLTLLRGTLLSPRSAWPPGPDPIPWVPLFHLRRAQLSLSLANPKPSCPASPAPVVWR